MLAGLGVAGSVAANDAPLSAIDWLKNPAPIHLSDPLQVALPAQPGMKGAEDREAEDKGARVPQIEVTPLTQQRADAAGLLSPETTGLPATLWQESATETLVALLRRLPADPLPSLQSLYYTLLLAEADPPGDARGDPSFLRARLDALRRLGAVDPALALANQAGERDAAVFDAWFDLSLLTGTEDGACTALVASPDLTQRYDSRIFCLARSGDWSTAALVLQSAKAIGAITPRKATMLEAFLDPDLVGLSPEMAPSTAAMTPLLFRLHEAVGAPLPTTSLPREYAMADLRGFSGWKAEIEAAERLTHSGALPANRLLGLYTDRSPAASGGVWDRAEGVQALERALTRGESAAVSDILPPLWRAMRREGLATAFAAMFAEDLSQLELEPEAQRVAFHMALLSTDYRRLAPILAASSPEDGFLASLAQGRPDPNLARSPGEQAVVAGFAATGASPDHADLLEAGRVGQAILLAALQLDRATPNALRDIEAGLATLRALGLEDTARRTALEILLLRKDA
ncbi:MAG: hypothetical protein AAF686_03610 [Pseudomonadota bacterium]